MFKFSRRFLSVLSVPTPPLCLPSAAPCLFKWSLISPWQLTRHVIGCYYYCNVKKVIRMQWCSGAVDEVRGGMGDTLSNGQGGGNWCITLVVITSLAKEVMLLVMLICLFVCLLAKFYGGVQSGLDHDPALLEVCALRVLQIYDDCGYLCYYTMCRKSLRKLWYIGAVDKVEAHGCVVRVTGLWSKGFKFLIPSIKLVV